MKYTNKCLWGLVAVACLSSCAEDKFDSYVTPEPASLAESQYLNAYKVLKDYSPNLKLGAVVTASDYTSQGLLYGLAKSNFSEVSGGTSLNHASLVKKSGGVDVGTVEDFLKSAKDAGQTVFGPSLLSNTGNNTSYFKSILANRVDPNYEPQLVEMTGHDDTRCIRVPASARVEQPWDNQFWVVFDAPVSGGESYELNMMIRADKEVTGIGTQLHKEPGQYLSGTGFGSVPFSTEWKEFKYKGTFGNGDATGKSIAFNLNDFQDENIYYFKDLSLKIGDKEVLGNGDLKKEEDGTSFIAKYDREGAGVDGYVYKQPAKIVNGYNYIYMGDPNLTQTFVVDGPCLVVHAKAKEKENYDNQFWIVFPEGKTAKGGDSWEYTMKVRAVNEAFASTQIHQDPQDYIFWQGIDNVNFTTEWETITKSGTFAATDQWGDNKSKIIKSIAFNLSDYAGENTYFFAYISFKVNGEEMVTNPDLSTSDNKSFQNIEYGGAKDNTPISTDGYTWTITKTPDKPLEDWEKHDTIRYALRSYISEIMEAAKGAITSWDILANVVADDGSGVRAASESDASSFNWSEYLNGPNMDGSNPSEFVQLTFKYAREYYAANGGNEGNLKFFINEDGLGNSAKLAGLNKLLSTWEQDKSVKFDGISTSLSASFSEDEATYTTEKKNVEDFFKALAGTGRLIRISGLNVDYKDASGAAVEATKLTVDQAKKMGEFYKYIAQQYKALIPDNQKAGLYINNIFDNGSISGLWNKTNNSRKPQYGGFAEGLE